jgi:hypothetical protein
MHAVLELEVADGELRVVDVGIERVERSLVDAVVLGELRVEALEGAEVVALMGVEERLAEMGIPRRAALRRSGEGGAASRWSRGRERGVAAPSATSPRS